MQESIKWIGEGKKKELEDKRKEYHKLFKDADEIYFLGFGFDINNLYQLGILDKNGELEQDLKEDQLTKKKKIFISGGNAKIITLLKEKFDIENESSTILGESIEATNSKFDIENESITITGQSTSESKSKFDIENASKIKWVTSRAKSKNIGIYRLQNDKYDIRVSPQYLPDALDEDL